MATNKRWNNHIGNVASLSLLLEKLMSGPAYSLRLSQVVADGISHNARLRPIVTNAGRLARCAS
eukprot:scaffold88469_cov31-Prasinocladus_malaysianus.AAC.3